MSTVRRSALAALAVLLAAPSSGALAQNGAGDNQYTDPFAGSGGGSHSGSKSGSSGTGFGGGGGSQTSSSGTSSGTPSLSSTPPSSGTSSGTNTSSAPSEAQAAAQPTGVTATGLPATGGEPGLVALLGAGMLLAGTGLRVRLRAGER
jgi:hypothetical protein